MDRLKARELPGTDSALAPAISPDGAQVAFVTGERYTERALKIVSLRGGPPVTVLKGEVWANVSWGPQGYVYFLASSGRMLRRVASSGGAAEDVVRLPEPDSNTTYEYLSVLPGGKAALVSAFPANRVNASAYALRAVDLETGKFGATVEGVAGQYTTSGHLVYTTYPGTLMGVSFDPRTLSLRGRPAAFIEGLDVRLGGFTDLAISDNGTLAYATAGLNAAEDFVWVSRGGVPSIVDPGWNDVEFEDFELSPDGGRIAVNISGGRDDIWIKQLDRGPKSRLTFGGESNRHPAWTPDGKYVSFVSDRAGRSALWRRRSDGVGSEEQVLDIGREIVETRWSRDGAWLLLTVVGSTSSFDILGMRLGVDSVPSPLLAEQHDEGLPALSPDGRWLAYVSTETGEAQIFVRPFPAVQQGKWQISTAGGDDPAWTRDGRELHIRSPAGGHISVVDKSRGPSQSSPKRLLQLPVETKF